MLKFLRSLLQWIEAWMRQRGIFSSTPPLLLVEFRATRTKEGEVWVYTSASGSRVEAEDPYEAQQALTAMEQERVLDLALQVGVNTVIADPERFACTSVRQIPLGEAPSYGIVIPTLVPGEDGRVGLLEVGATCTLFGPDHDHAIQ